VDDCASAADALEMAMSASLSLYEARPSTYHQLHPQTKLEISAAVLVIGLLWPGPWGSYVVLALMVVPLTLWSQVGRSMWRSVGYIVWPFALSAFLIQGLFWRSGPAYPLFGPLYLHTEGLWYAVESSGRVALITSSLLLLALTTRPDMLMLAMTRMGLPHAIAYIVVTTIQIVPRFQARARTIADAQQARGLEVKGGFLQRVRALPPLVMPLVLGSLVEVEERAMALDARGFATQGPKTSLIELVDSPNQRRVRWLLRGLVVVMIGVRVLWQLSN
jgi:energy-coupling factor transport system permease protein